MWGSRWALLGPRGSTKLCQAVPTHAKPCQKALGRSWELAGDRSSSASCSKPIFFDSAMSLCNPVFASPHRLPAAAPPHPQPSVEPGSVGHVCTANLAVHSANYSLSGGCRLEEQG